MFAEIKFQENFENPKRIYLAAILFFFFPERSHVAALALLTLKAKWFATLNLKINGNNDEQVVLMFSTTNEKTTYEQLLQSEKERIWYGSVV